MYVCVCVCLELCVGTVSTAVINSTSVTCEKHVKIFAGSHCLSNYNESSLVCIKKKITQTNLLIFWKRAYAFV